MNIQFKLKCEMLGLMQDQDKAKLQESMQNVFKDMSDTFESVKKAQESKITQI